LCVRFLRTRGVRLGLGAPFERNEMKVIARSPPPASSRSARATKRDENKRTHRAMPKMRGRHRSDAPTAEAVTDNAATLAKPRNAGENAADACADTATTDPPPGTKRRCLGRPLLVSGRASHDPRFCRRRVRVRWPSCAMPSAAPRSLMMPDCRAARACMAGARPALAAQLRADERLPAGAEASSVTSSCTASAAARHRILTVTAAPRLCEARASV
jgi:hypothetical protein